MPIPTIGRVLLAAVVALLAVSCGDSDGSGESAGSDAFESPFTNAKAYPVMASPEIVVGENRVLMGLLNEDDAPIGSERVAVEAAFFDLDVSETKPATTANFAFVPIDRHRGIYRAQVAFESPGRWGAEVSIRGGGFDETVRTSFEVEAEPTTPAIGERVPAVDTPTADEAKLSEISTDKKPDPRFYETSIAQAVRAHEPFVVVFATPQFCQTATCGPMLQIVKRVAPGFDDITFIHVEPYDLSKTPQKLEPVDAVLEWGLPSEPWVFVVDESGKLVTKYAVVLSPQELADELGRF
jgi:hypothetical protein